MKQIPNILNVLLLFIAGITFGQINLDQQVIGAAGGFHQVPGGNSYSYTVGETIVATQSTFSTTLILTQGFQQTFSSDSVVTYSTISESCPGAADGAIVVSNILRCPAPYVLVVNNVATNAVVPSDSLVTGNYALTATGTNGCAYSANIFVGINNSSGCEVTYEVNNESCPGAGNGSIFINNVEGYPGPYDVVVKTTTIDSAIVEQNSLFSAVYSVIITGVSGAPYLTQIEVGLDSSSDCEVKFYSGITPNGDGNNDTWIIDDIEFFPENTVQIFNRWGAEAWVGKAYDNATVVWNGLDKNGIEMADATYFYVAVVGGKTYKGFIELTR